jgi:D-xylose transport system ATP-binding protein
VTLLSLKNISIEFPGVKALDDVSLDLHEGEIHSLVGENGAGKSTLIKIIGGVWTAGMYSGVMSVAGKEVRFNSVRDSEDAQIQIIHQELSLVNQMTVAENICLGNEPLRFGAIDHVAMNAGAQAALSPLSPAIKPHHLVSDLTIGEQQIVEIAKALSKKARILVFDEPTAALPEKDVENLLALIIELKRKGIGIIYISHKLNEVCAISDKVTVLRNGRRVSQFNQENLNTRDMVRDMIGRSLETAFPPLSLHRRDEELLSVRDLVLRDPTHYERAILKNVSFHCRKGEVIGFAGLLGSGRTALLSALFGVFQGPYEGHITFEGRPYKPQSPSDAIRKGIALVSEDRKRFGLIGTGNVAENFSVAALARFCRMGVIDHAKVTADCSRYVNDLNVKTPSLEFPVANLSGGNQQKVILGRFLMTEPRLLLLDDPTRGIDVGAKFEIYRLIHALADRGIGIIFISSELPEVLGVAHRVYVLQGNGIRSEFSHGEKSEEETLALAAGV